MGELLGKGGYGTVHRAWDERLCRHVAVKAVEGEAAGRVMREAHAAARLNHPGIVTLYELGAENGVTYLVSELVQGPNLREHAAAGRLSDRDVAELGVEVCSALAHAHSQGVVHRDLKPDNVLIRARRGRSIRPGDGRAVLADFGIATVADEPTLTATGQVIGTLAYMSPEQAAGEETGPPSDVYSLALSLYELWAGHNPVAGPTPAATARRIGTDLPSLGESRPELPTGLHATLAAALDPDPELRPELPELAASLADLSGALHPDRAVPEPEQDELEETESHEVMAARPFAVLFAAFAIGALGLLAGYPGVALVLTLLLAPAALLLGSPRDWVAPAIAPLLGLIGLAPLFLVFAARHRRPAARAALAGLGWAWCALVAAFAGQALGVLEPGDAGGWATSAGTAADSLIAPLAGADPLATGLIWIGAAVLLGLVIEFASPALMLLLGLVWSAGLVAALGAIGGASGPSALLTPALIAAVCLLAWDRAGRPALAGALPERVAGGLRGIGSPEAEAAAEPARRPRPARPPAALGDERAVATRAASRHVRAALHGAGSRAGLP